MTDETAPTEDETSETAAAPALTKAVIIGRKVGMLQHFRPDGSVVGATVIATESNLITRVATKERDGYTAVQIGFGAVAEKKMSKGERGHLKDLPPLKHLREIRVVISDSLTDPEKRSRLLAIILIRRHLSRSQSLHVPRVKHFVRIERSEYRVPEHDRRDDVEMRILVLEPRCGAEGKTLIGNLHHGVRIPRDLAEDHRLKRKDLRELLEYRRPGERGE